MPAPLRKPRREIPAGVLAVDGASGSSFCDGWWSDMPSSFALRSRGNRVPVDRRTSWRYELEDEEVPAPGLGRACKTCKGEQLGIRCPGRLQRDTWGAAKQTN